MDRWSHSVNCAPKAGRYRRIPIRMIEPLRVPELNRLLEVMGLAAYRFPNPQR